MKLSERYTEMWGLYWEGGAEYTYSIKDEVAQLEAENERLRELLKAGASVIRQGGHLNEQWIAESDTLLERKDDE